MKYQPPFGSDDLDAPYINGDPTIGQQGSIPPAASIEFPQREIVNFIGASDQIPNDADLYQLTHGIRNQYINFCVDTGATNAVSIALDPPLAEYKQGVPLRVLIANTNTGSTTINVNSLGARPIKRSSGASLEAGDLAAGMIALLVDDGTNYQIMNYMGAPPSTVNNFTTDIPYAEDSSVVLNSVVAIFAPAITDPIVGDLILVKIKQANSLAVTITVNALAPIPITRNDGKPLQGDDLIVDETLILIKKVASWQVMRLVRSQVYIRLTTNLTLYVRTDGNDTTGDGAQNTALRAFKTIRRAVQYIQGSFLIAGRTATIQLGIPGVYQGQVLVSGIAGSLVIIGDRTNINSYIIQGDPAPGQGGPGWFNTVMGISGSGTAVHILGVTFASADPTFFELDVGLGATAFISDVAFAGVAGPNVYCCRIDGGGVLACSYNIHIYRNCSAVFSLQNGGILEIGEWYTLMHLHGVTFSAAFVHLMGLCHALISSYSCGFTGSAFGPRYYVIWNSNLITQGGPNSLPGNQPGAKDDSSVYT